MQDYQQALYYYEKSADNGGSFENSVLADRYIQGKIVQRNNAYAVQLYRKAFELGQNEENKHGFSMACYGLGICYYFGFGVVADQVQGIEYMKQAAEFGDEYALEFLNASNKQQACLEKYEQANSLFDTIVDAAGMIPGVSEISSAAKIGKKIGEGLAKLFGN